MSPSTILLPPSGGIESRLRLSRACKQVQTQRQCYFYITQLSTAISTPTIHRRIPFKLSPQQSICARCVQIARRLIKCQIRTYAKWFVPINRGHFTPTFPQVCFQCHQRTARPREPTNSMSAYLWRLKRSNPCKLNHCFTT